MQADSALPTRQAAVDATEASAAAATPANAASIHVRHPAASPWGRSSPRERLSEYARIAHERFETEKFGAFCREHLGHLDELAYDFFGSTVMRDAIREKVELLFPPHEVEEFAELFWSRVQLWREQEGRHGDKDGF